MLSTDHAVCANSKNARGACSGELTWPEAKQFCEEQGARLCSQEELFNDDTHGYGTLCPLFCGCVFAAVVILTLTASSVSLADPVCASARNGLRLATGAAATMTTASSGPLRPATRAVTRRAMIPATKLTGVTRGTATPPLRTSAARARSAGLAPTRPTHAAVLFGLGSILTVSPRRSMACAEKGDQLYANVWQLVLASKNHKTAPAAGDALKILIENACFDSPKS